MALPSAPTAFESIQLLGIFDDIDNCLRQVIMLVLIFVKLAALCHNSMESNRVTARQQSTCGCAPVAYLCLITVCCLCTSVPDIVHSLGLHYQIAKSFLLSHQL